MTRGSRALISFAPAPVIVMALWLLVAGCATPSTLPDVLTPVEMVHQGVVSGSFAFEEAGDMTFPVEQSFHLKDLRTQKIIYLPVKRTKDTNRYFVGQECWGVPFARALVPGSYAFVGWSGEKIAMNGNRVRMSMDFNFPFEVSAGHLVYVGEMKLKMNPTVVTQASFWNTQTSNTVNVKFSNESRRDLRLLRTLYPTIDWDKAKVDLSQWDVANPRVKRIDAAPEWARGTSMESLMKVVAPVTVKVPEDQAPQD